MQEIRPEYYSDFKCIASNCPDNCCIGWQICLDEKTAQNYLSSSLSISNVAKSYLRGSKNSRFLALKNGRCPYLDEKNLCEVIKEKGEEYLCEVCANHPRFTKDLGDAKLIFLSLSCPQASKLFCNLSKIKRISYLGESWPLLYELKKEFDCMSLIEKIINKPRFEELFSNLFMQMEYLDEQTKQLLTNVKTAEIKQSLTLLNLSNPFFLISLFDYFYSVGYGEDNCYNCALFNVIGVISLFGEYGEEKSIYAYVKEIEHSVKNEKILRRKVSSPLYKSLLD